MLRILSIAIVLGLLTAGATTWAGQKKNRNNQERCTPSFIRGGDKPLPLEYEVELPWTKLDGVWETIGPAPLTFDLEADPIQRSINFRFLDKDMFTVAQGTGFATTKQRGVVAYLNVSDQVLRVRLGAYMMKSGQKLREVLVMELRQYDPYGALVSKGMFLMKRVTTGPAY